MSLTRIGSIGINTGIAFAGVTTIVTLNTANDALSIGATVNVGSGITLGASGDIFATGVSTVTTLKVGSGVTVSSDGDIFATGVCTATSFSGTIEVSSDTSPQLGGNLDVNTKNILFGDSSDGSSDDVLKFGAGSDLNIYHNGTHSFIKNDNGTLVLNSDAISLTNNAGNSNRITSHSGGEVKLYYSDSVKLQTSSTGVSITGVLDLSSHLDMGDSDVIKLGDGDDLQIYHSGSLNLIDVYTNNLQIRNGSSEKMAVFNRNDSVELYFDNAKRFETFAGGVKLGNITNQLFWPYDGNSNSRSWAWRGENGSYGIFELDHSDGADETLDKTSIRATANAGVDLYANNVKKLGTNATYGTILSNTTDDANFTNALLLTRRGYETSGYGVALQPKGGSVSSQNGLRVQISDGSTPTYNTKFTFDNDGLKFGTDTASANALDDYEEGTFTPTLIYQNTSGLTLATNSASGKYTKVGRVVWILGYINWSVSGSPINDNVGFGGLPFSTNTGQITAGSTRFIGNVTLLNTNAQSSIHQIQPYGTNGVALQTEAEQGNRSNELGSGNSFQARYQFWYHTE